MKERGIEQFDFVYVIGDAYVDHSSFGPAIISRVLEANGYSVGIISQPDWKDENSISIFGEPRLGFLVSSGNMDSMVNHYTVAKKHRKTDAFTPGGVMGKRPDRAVTVYGNLIRRTYKHTPMILGGIEASLRRLSHYDYWSDQVRRSVLLDSGADLISYGMGELSIVAIADALAAGIDVHDVTFIPGTVYRSKTLDHLIDPVVLPSFEEVRESKRTYAESFAIQYKNTDAINAKPMAEPYEGQGYIVQNPPSRPLTEQEMDDVYALPYMRAYHPSYEKDGGVPALGEIKYSLTSNRGCFGSCSFCALTFHEGRVVQTRSHESILAEARQMVQEKEFKGYIHDVGGPTADFRGPACKKQLTKGACPNRNCLFPEPCKNMVADHRDYVKLLRELKDIPGVKKVFIRSGIRFDYVLADKDQTFLSELVKDHVSGQLRVAPEHVRTVCFPIWENRATKYIRNLSAASMRATKRRGSSSTHFHILCRPIRGVTWRMRWSLPSTSAIWDLSRSRHRTSIRRLPHFPPVCTIPVLTRGRWIRFTCRNRRMRRRCSVR